MKNPLKENSPGRNLRTSGPRTGLFLFFLLACPVFFFSCSQDPIFFEISKEEAPKEPRIKGTPANLIILGNSLYTASYRSGNIHRYTAGAWAEDFGAGGSVWGLGGTTGYLYTLRESSSLRRTNSNGGSWGDVALGDAGKDYIAIQTIYGAGDTLFVGARHATDYTKYGVFYVKDGGGSLSLLTEGPDRLLKGAAWDGTDYYIATGKGIFIADGTTMTLKNSDPAEGTGDYNVVGILALNGEIAAVSRNKLLLYNSSAARDVFKNSGDTGLTFTGAMALWQDSGGADTLLLLGIQGPDTSRSHGYREVLLADGKINPGKTGMRTPGDTQPSSVEDHYKYNSTIGTHPVLFICQPPPAVDGDRTLFAATSKNGLWSYRRGVWNAEE